jgi:hypothetical protein
MRKSSLFVFKKIKLGYFTNSYAELGLHKTYQEKYNREKSKRKYICIERVFYTPHSKVVLSVLGCATVIIILPGSLILI